MTGRATFGDFAQAARAHLDEALADDDWVKGTGQAAGLARQSQELVWSLRAAVEVMARYLADVNTPFEVLFDRWPGRLPPWARAGFAAQAALGQAVALLDEVQLGDGQPGAVPTSGAAGRMEAAAAAMRCGRDLLYTHFGLTPEGYRSDRSEWAPAITSNPVTRALMLEVGLWARQTAQISATIALPARGQLHGEHFRRNVNAASQWLWSASAAIHSARQQVPEPAAAITLLHAIPVNQVGARTIPGDELSIAALCRGAVTCAERIRYLARRMEGTACWAPGLTADSLRQTATCAVAIGHHCQVLLRTLAGQAARPRLASGSWLLAAADAAGQARQAWMHAARSWDTATTSTSGALSAVAVETADLALWTGRLAYASPAWSLSLGPHQPARTAGELIARLADVPQVISAIHQACETITLLAAAEHDQIAAAWEARRLLVTTRSLPDTFDIPFPFAIAPRYRVDQILATYRDAGIASTRAAGRVAETAMQAGAPSRILAAVRAATYGTAARPPWPEESTDPRDRPHVRSSPGPVEQALHDMGVADPAALGRAAVIDHAAEQLILQHAQRAAISRRRQRALRAGRSTATAQLASHLLASGSPGAATVLAKPPMPAEPDAAIAP